MSISEPTEFDHWIAEAFAATGPFTALVVLVEIADTQVTPLCTTYFNVIGDEFDWEEIVVLFAGSGVNWHGASFYPITAPEGGPIDNPTARARLRELERRLNADRLVLNEGFFFDQGGRRLKIEEAMQ